ncbi:MAG: toxin-antitoxin system YwqK family antitoxin [Bacteroidales bacterium]|nr:toxin-antitoxin system YwqK family antitoxin [Bacteroidales bacterium]
MRKLIILFISMAFLYACQAPQVQVVEDVYADGSIRSIVDYKISSNDSIPLHQLDFHKDGSKRMEGYFVDGERDGEWLSWYADGDIWSKGYFKNGKRTGKAWVYHPNGKLFMKGTYENGQKTGNWLVFDEDGNLISDTNY